MKWLIETTKDVPDNVDRFVDGLEELLNMHVEVYHIVHEDAATNPLEWCTGLLEGLAFVQANLFDNPNREMLLTATLNIANIALTFNRSLANGTYSELGISEVAQQDTTELPSTTGQEAQVQGGSEDLPQPAHDQHSGMGGDASPLSLVGDDIV